MDLIINISDKDDYKPLHQATVRQANTPLTAYKDVYPIEYIVFINKVDHTVFWEDIFPFRTSKSCAGALYVRHNILM